MDKLLHFMRAMTWMQFFFFIVIFLLAWWNVEAGNYFALFLNVASLAIMAWAVTIRMKRSL